MFTGIIETIGRVKAVERRGDGASLALTAEFSANDIKVGNSVAINGVCLTVTSQNGNSFHADLGLETLKVTTLSGLLPGDFVNVERAMQMGGRLDGHLVQGHVDGIGKVININRFDNGLEVTLEATPSISKYLVKRGSVAVNGVSLTIIACGKTDFKVFLIPHTIEATTLKHAKEGDEVNLEVDIIGKYVEKLARPDTSEDSPPSKVTDEFLKRHGF